MQLLNPESIKIVNSLLCAGVLFVISLFLPQQLKAGEFPSQEVPQTFGVCISGHELDEIDFPALRKAGFRWIRKGVAWNQMEKEKGVYDFTNADELVKKCEDNDLGLLMTLAFGNKLYEPQSHRMVVSTPEGREGFANYAAALVKRYKGKKIIYEFWNEASGSFWKSKKKKTEDQAKEFMAMQDLAAKKMRAADPKCKIAGAALYHIGWKKSIQWLDVCLDQKIHKSVDAIAFHAYGGRGDNDIVENNVAWYQAMQKQLAKHGAPEDFPFMQTEYGINVQFTNWNGSPQERELKQAQSIVRCYLVSLLLKMPMNIHYEYKSRKKDTKGDKGLVRMDGTEAPVYEACRVVMRVLNGYTFDKRLNDYGKNTYVLVFNNKSGQTKLAGWTSERDKTQEVTIPITGTEVTVWDMMGKESKLKSKDGKLKVTLSNYPQYLAIK